MGGMAWSWAGNCLGEHGRPPCDGWLLTVLYRTSSLTLSCDMCHSNVLVDTSWCPPRLTTNVLDPPPGTWFSPSRLQALVSYYGVVFVDGPLSVLHNNCCGQPWCLLSPAGEIAVCVLIISSHQLVSFHPPYNLLLYLPALMLVIGQWLALLIVTHLRANATSPDSTHTSLIGLLLFSLAENWSHCTCTFTSTSRVWTWRHYCLFKMLKTDYPVMQHYILEHNCQSYCYEKLNTLKNMTIRCRN